MSIAESVTETEQVANVNAMVSSEQEEHEEQADEQQAPVEAQVQSAVSDNMSHVDLIAQRIAADMRDGTLADARGALDAQWSPVKDQYAADKESIAGVIAIEQSVLTPIIDDKIAAARSHIEDKANDWIALNGVIGDGPGQFADAGLIEQAFEKYFWTELAPEAIGASVDQSDQLAAELYASLLGRLPKDEAKDANSAEESESNEKEFSADAVA